MSSTKTKQQKDKPQKRKFSVKKLILIILAIPVLIVTTVIISAFIYKPLQKPAFVNKELSFQNKLHIPSELKPRIENGEKVFDLTVQQGETEFLPGKRTKTIGFNGNYLGPTIRAHRDDNIRMNVTNSLSDSATTHWHGMHLPAAMDGNDHQLIKPNETWRPYWTVTNQASSLWYHSHMMNKTAEQVYRGLAGLFIIDDDNSDSLEIPNDYGTDDIPLIVQDREFDERGQFVYDAERKDVFGHTGVHGDSILVNGTYAPYVEVPAKQVRLRLLNGSNARRYKFEFENKLTFQQVATDGGFLNAPVALNSLTLAPGERAEIVADLTNQTAPLVLMSNAIYEDNTVLRFMKNLLRANRDENQVFKIIEIRPKHTGITSAALPQTLNKIQGLTASEAVKTRRFVLDAESRSINGRRMDPKRIDEIVHSGDSEIWEINNQSGIYHPIHIHAIQFQILSRNGKPPEPNERGWKDTVLVENAETVRVIARFPEFSDTHIPYMFHCHILEHEDMGMMGQFVVVGKDTNKDDIFVRSHLTESGEAMPGHE
jgi:FtsP/CotA-like multicopper oxidase with cupredoxin domain